MTKESWFRLLAGAWHFLYSKTCRPALLSTQPTIQWAPRASSRGIKRPGLEAHHSDYEWSQADCQSPVYLYGMHRDNFTCPHQWQVMKMASWQLHSQCLLRHECNENESHQHIVPCLCKIKSNYFKLLNFPYLYCYNSCSISRSGRHQNAVCMPACLTSNRDDLCARFHTRTTWS